MLNKQKRALIRFWRSRFKLNRYKELTTKVRRNAKLGKPTLNVSFLFAVAKKDLKNSVSIS